MDIEYGKTWSWFFLKEIHRIRCIREKMVEGAFWNLIQRVYREGLGGKNVKKGKT